MPTRSGVAVLLWVVMLTGCGRTTPEEAMGQRSLSDIIAEADELSNEGLQRQARAYHDAIVQLNQELDRLRRTKEDLDYKEKTGPKAEELDAKMQSLGESIGRLMKRHRVYIDKLHQKGLPTDECEL